MGSTPIYRFESEGSLFPDVISTERLDFEQLCYGNISIMSLYEVLGKSETIAEETEYVNWAPHDTPEDTKYFIEQAEEKWRSGDKCTYIVRTEETDGGEEEFAGITTLTVDWNRRVGDLGIYLRKQFWGRRYSAERSGAFLELAFDHLDLEVIEVNCFLENERAKRAIEKYVEEYGGEYVGIRYNMVENESGRPLDCHLYTITREQFRKNERHI